MHVIRVGNVCEALPEGVAYLAAYGQQEQSRAGPVLVAPGPVTTVYERPRERVLFSRVRDANPFFHLYEAIWMLGGRNDVAPLLKFVPKFGGFAEAGGVQHGAYGHRWRQAFGIDQLQHVIRTLTRDPTSRQCVVQMWDCRDPDSIQCDEGEGDLTGEWRDRPCNTHLYLRIRGAERYLGVNNEEVVTGPHLDLTILCRSNDMIWGGYGANAVHFSVLMEYLAARIGVEVGAMYQVSNNYHVYEAELNRLLGRCVPPHVTELDRGEPLYCCLDDNRYETGLSNVIGSTVMFDEPQWADADINLFLARFDMPEGSGFANYHNWWFDKTLVPAMIAHRLYKRGNGAAALQIAESMQSPDWRVACVEWLQRREKA